MLDLTIRAGSAAEMRETLAALLDAAAQPVAVVAQPAPPPAGASPADLLASVSYDVLLAEVMRRAGERGYVLTLSDMGATDDQPAQPAEAAPAAADPHAREKPVRRRKPATPPAEVPAEDMSADGDTPAAVPVDEAAGDAAPLPETPAPAGDDAMLAAAVAKLSSVFARPTGKAAIAKARAHFGVGKFVEVPASRAAELMEWAERLDAETAAT